MSKFTRKAIMDSFMELLQKKSLDKITVKDIIEMADINRNTFYYHFEDIYDLLEKTFEEESVQFWSNISAYGSFEEEYLRLIELVYDNKDAILHLYNSKSREVLQRYIQNSTNHFVLIHVQKAAEGSGISREGEDYITNFYTYAIIGATLRWVEKDMPNHRDGLIQTVAASFDATIDAMIKTYIDGHPEECRSRA